jgi:diketogulonate reductase-like aldo/keto reductase
MHTTLSLNNGHTIPTLGLGTWNSPKGAVKAAVEYAVLEAGYRHIDCASIYGNQKEIGEALATIFSSKKVTRDELFITSKLWNTDHDPKDVERACKQTLRDLQLEYLDLYLVHWGIAFAPGKIKEPLDKDGIIKTIPVSTQETWQAMEKLADQGLAQSIGVANFTTMMLFDLLTYARIKPVMNQIELHPYNAQRGLVAFCQRNKVAVTAYSPLGTPGGLEVGDPKLLDDEVVTTIAKSHKKSPAQVLLKWALQRGTIAIPKSTNPERIVENMAVYDFELTADEMKELEALDRKHRFVHPIGWWGVPYFE